jgi:hypothetical protein
MLALASFLLGLRVETYLVSTGTRPEALVCEVELLDA